ncbi:MAG: protein-L-isoaspartate(D-aspartate) O-methyltransferase [Candidatus Krumholzibacteriia bacterium]
MTHEYAVARRRMVREQIVAAGITDPAILAALAEVPRHRFVPGPLQHRAYQASALPIGYGQTISKPFTVGLMTALLELQGHEHVLEIGTGSGYQAAVLSRLTRSVVTIERIRPLADRARGLLAGLGYDNIDVLAADGAAGCWDAAPFDAAVVTACSPGVPTQIIDQIRDGGFILLPIAAAGRQTLYRYQRRGSELVVEESVPCAFVPLLSGLEEGNTDA